MRPADARRRHRVPSAASDPVISLGHLKCRHKHPSYAPPNCVLRAARAAHAEALDTARARPSPTLDRGAAGHRARPVRTPAPKQRVYRLHHTPGRLRGRARRHWCRGWVTPAARGCGKPLAGGCARDPGGSARASRAAALPEARRAPRPGNMSWTAQITAVPPVSRPPKLRPARRAGGPRGGFGPRPGRRGRWGPKISGRAPARPAPARLAPPRARDLGRVYWGPSRRAESRPAPFHGRREPPGPRPTAGLRGPAREGRSGQLARRLGSPRPGLRAAPLATAPAHSTHKGVRHSRGRPAFICARMRGAASFHLVGGGLARICRFRGWQFANLAAAPSRHAPWHARARRGPGSFGAVREGVSIGADGGSPPHIVAHGPSTGGLGAAAGTCRRAATATVVQNLIEYFPGYQLVQKYLVY